MVRCIKDRGNSKGKEYFDTTPLEERYIVSALSELEGLVGINPAWDKVRFEFEASSSGKKFFVAFIGSVNNDNPEVKEITLLNDSSSSGSDLPALEQLLKHFEGKFSAEIMQMVCTKRKGAWGRFKFILF